MSDVHLHWGRHPDLLRGIVTHGIALCGVTVPREQLTAFRDDTTCKVCLKKSEHPQDFRDKE